MAQRKRPSRRNATRPTQTRPPGRTGRRSSGHRHGRRPSPRGGRAGARPGRRRRALRPQRRARERPGGRAPVASPVGGRARGLGGADRPRRRGDPRRGRRWRVHLEQPAEDEDDDEVTRELDALLSRFVVAAERDGTADAAGMLHALSTLLEGPVAAATTAASGRAVAAGATLPRWAALAGQPRAVRAWSYRDVLGVQESVTVEFACAHRPRAVSVLVDRELGGGVKDVWFAAGRDVDGLRSGYAQVVASEEITEVVDLALQEAAAALRRALEHEPCPEQPDQVEDVVRLLPLLRSRVARLERCQEPLQG